MKLLNARGAVASAAVLILLSPSPGAAQADDAIIREALSAAPAGVALDATVMDWEQNVLREGTNGWTCLPAPPGMDTGPMCLDEPWLLWAHAWQTHGTVEIDRPGIAYMLQGDSGTSNRDPYAEGPTEDNQWVVEGPHLMIIVPDPTELDGITTDPRNGGPYVMWKGTPYAHLMVPVH